MASNMKIVSLEDVKKHNKPDDLWVVIHDQVYDLSKFREEHPGGSEVLEDVAGKEATQEFEEIGHSLDAKKQMKQYLIGELQKSDKKESGKVSTPSGSGTCCDKKRLATIIGSTVIAGIGAALIAKACLMKKNL